MKVFLRAGQMAELDARRAEVLGNAARIIQRQSRTYIARKEFIALRKAAITMQSCLRGIFSSLKLYHIRLFLLHRFLLNGQVKWKCCFLCRLECYFVLESLCFLDIAWFFYT